MKFGYRKILIVSEADVRPKKIYIDQMPKLAKGWMRLGHDVRMLSYTSIMGQLSPFKNRALNNRFYKGKVDDLVCKYIGQYQPHIIFVGFARGLDAATVRAFRDAAPAAVFIGWDGDPWPGDNPGRLALGASLDILFATNNGSFLDEYRRHGAKRCVFMPNLIDPDNDRRYAVGPEWHSDVLWTGKVQHSAGHAAGETGRQEVLDQARKLPGIRIYGCLGQPSIGGLDYLYAVSGAKIGISINATNCVPLYHSDRFTHYSACGTLILAKRVPDTELLMEDGRHVRYFDTAEECLELARWYLAHEEERQRIADAGMARCHATFNAERIGGYILDVIETGQYQAPWGSYCAN